MGNGDGRWGWEIGKENGGTGIKDGDEKREMRIEDGGGKWKMGRKTEMGNRKENVKRKANK